MAIGPDSVAVVVARLLKRRGVERVFALCGGHIMPIWMRLDAEGIPIVDVRDERAAVYMAHAHAELEAVAARTIGSPTQDTSSTVRRANHGRTPRRPSFRVQRGILSLTFMCQRSRFLPLVEMTGNHATSARNR